MRRKTTIMTVLTLVLAMIAPVPGTFARKSGQKGIVSASAGKTSKQSSGKSSANKTSKKKNTSSSGKGKTKSKETAADIKKRQEEAQKEIRLTQQQIKENDAAVKKSLNELGKLEEDIDKGKVRVAEASGKVNALQKQIGSLQTRIAADEKRLEHLRTEYLKAVKKMRAKRKQQSALAFVFSSGSFNQALRRMRYLRQVSDWRDRQTAEIGRRVASLKQQSDQLARTKTMHDKALAESVQAQNQLQAQYDKQDAIVVDLKKNGAALHSHLSKKQAEVNTLKNRVAALIAEEQRKAEAERRAQERAEAERKAKAEAQARAQAEAQAREQAEAKAREEQQRREAELLAEQNKKNEVSYAEARRRKPRSQASKTSPEPSGNQAKSSAPKPKETAKPQGGGNFESMKGSLPKPVAGSFRVTSRFGRHSLPDLPDVMYDNPGIDAEVAPGAAAQAVYAGKVSGVYMIPGYSTVVIVNHGGYYTVYGNIASASVKVGDVVRQGQALGRLAPDEDDPSHSSIHFEVWKNRDKLDPLGWIR